MSSPLERTDLLVLGTVNAPLKRQMASTDLVQCLASEDPDPWLVHIAAFFTEVSPDLIVSFADGHGVDRRSLARTYFATKTRTGILHEQLEVRLGRLANPS
ncbi:hypothetical protein [Salinarimonas sp.]|uniref:hypothetical protein n=1 Tax=Salinarimonas sp. TaxID=2766526 RepID=UPI0032D97B68